MVIIIRFTVNNIFLMLRVKSICEQKGISLKELSTLMGVTAESISRALSEKGNPTLGTLAKFAKALDVEVYELFDKYNREDIIQGYLEVGREMYRISNFKDLEKIYLELKPKNNL